MVECDFTDFLPVLNALQPYNPLLTIDAVSPSSSPRLRHAASGGSCPKKYAVPAGTETGPGVKLAAGAGVIDLPTIRDRIHAEPDHEPHWVALAAWLRDNGRVDEAAAVRVFWPALADGIGPRSPLDRFLALVARHAVRLGTRAREAAKRGRGEMSGW
jgi:hypothetical protein